MFSGPPLVAISNTKRECHFAEIVDQNLTCAVPSCYQDPPVTVTATMTEMERVTMTNTMTMTETMTSVCSLSKAT
jgi:hypothetical protein